MQSAEKKKKAQLNHRVRKVMNSVNKKGKIVEEVQPPGTGQNKSSLLEGTTPNDKVPLSEADSIFDADHQARGTAQGKISNQDIADDINQKSQDEDKLVSTIGEEKDKLENSKVEEEA